MKHQATLTWALVRPPFWFWVIKSKNTHSSKSFFSHNFISETLRGSAFLLGHFLSPPRVCMQECRCSLVLMRLLYHHLQLRLSLLSLPHWLELLAPYLPRSPPSLSRMNAPWRGPPWRSAWLGPHHHALWLGATSCMVAGSDVETVDPSPHRT